MGQWNAYHYLDECPGWRADVECPDRFNPYAVSISHNGSGHLPISVQLSFRPGNGGDDCGICGSTSTSPGDELSRYRPAHSWEMRLARVLPQCDWRRRAVGSCREAEICVRNVVDRI